MIDRSRIGYSTEPSTVDVDAWRVKLFCRAIGETDPVYVDETAARAAGFERRPVPPTFLKAVESEHASTAGLLELLGAPLRSVLHAEQVFEHQAAVLVGDAVEVQRQVVDIYDRKEGAQTFIVIDTRYRVSGRLAATSRQTLVVRNAPARA
jgi:acyl dehydratase